MKHSPIPRHTRILVLKKFVLRKIRLSGIVLKVFFVKRYHGACHIAKFWCQITALADNLNKLFTVMGGKFKMSALGCDLAPKFGNVTTTMISSDKKPPLMTQLFCKNHPLTFT